MILYSTQKHKRAFTAHLAASALAPGYGPGPACTLPEQLTRLIDKLECTLEFFEAVPIGADLTDVLPRWFLWLLTEELGQYPTSKPVAELYHRQLAGDPPTKKEWGAAYAAYAAAATAAAAYAAYAAAYAAYAATDATAYAAYAAIAATDAAATDTAACYKRMREALLRITHECSPT
jgi:hypothetical protein